MATDAQIADLRSMINEPGGEGYTGPYTDDVLDARIDAGTSLQSVAGSIWAEKAATFSGLVDVQEGSSRRSLGNLQSQALKMATHYQALAGEDVSTSSFRAARMRAIERP